MRNLPKDIVDFATEYFKCLQQGLILDYPHRGQNIPCDFEPSISKIPELLKNQSPKKERNTTRNKAIKKGGNKTRKKEVKKYSTKI